MVSAHVWPRKTAVKCFPAAARKAASACPLNAHPMSDPDILRLRKRAQFLFVRRGKSERRKTVVIQAKARDDGKAHIGEGFTATKKIGTAPIRNRSKRRLREAARLLLPKYGNPGTDYVFIARQSTASAAWLRLLDDVENALISLRDTPETPHKT